MDLSTQIATYSFALNLEFNVLHSGKEVESTTLFNV